MNEFLLRLLASLPFLLILLALFLVLVVGFARHTWLHIRGRRHSSRSCRPAQRTW